MKRVLLLSFFTLCALCSFAQLDPFPLDTDIPQGKRDSLYLDIYNFNYTRNYEYFNKIADGFTLFGLQLLPRLSYQATEHLSLSGGVFLQKDFGTRGLQMAEPYFSLIYQKGDLTLINGNIRSAAEHRYIDPVYDFDLSMTDPLELGTQVLIRKKKLFTDIWINWEKMIYKPSPVQEEVDGGISLRYDLLPAESKWKVYIPLQFFAYHKGGQIDTVDSPLQTFVNTASGLGVQKQIKGFVNYVRAEAYYLTYKDFSFTKLQPYLQGNGLFLNTGISTKAFGLFFTYWKGSGYQAVKGAPIYQSVSRHISHADFTEDTRELFFIRLVNSYPISPEFYIETRLEPYIDLNHPSFEFSNSLFLVYKDRIRLKKVKK